MKIRQAAITRYREKLQDSYLPEANRLLQVNLVDANRQQQFDSLLQIRDYLHWAKTKLQENSEAFLQHRLNGTAASPGDIGEVVVEAEEQIVAVDRRINYIMNPLVVLPLPAPAAAVRVQQPVPIVPQYTEGTTKASEGKQNETARMGQPNDPPPFDSVQESFISLDGPPIEQCTPSLKPSTITSERRTRESFNCTGRIPLINLKISKKDPKTNISSISPWRVLSEKVKKKNASRIYIVNPVR
ncbi:MAG: hypothetical protein GY696_28570, partial [Gammaproteobacteria bacterium]|nr:hypothetical protein [Gammaproteobacteria bacterium]